MFFFDFGVSIYFFFFNLFLSAHGYSESQMGLLTGAMAAGNLAGAVPAARLIERIGLRNVLVVCLLCALVVLATRALTAAFPLQAGLAFLTGLTLCMWAVCVAPITAAITTERERPLAFSMVFSLGIGVGAAGAWAGSRMPGWFEGQVWAASRLGPDQLTLLAACALAAIAFIPAVRLERCGGAVRPHPRALFTPSVRRILPAVGIWGLVTGSFAPFANVYLSTHIHLALHRIGTVFSLSQVCQVAAVLSAPLILRQLGVANGVFTMQIGTAFCLILLAVTRQPLAASMIYVALNGAQYMGEPAIYSLMMHAVPEEARGKASAAMAVVLGAAQLVAATIAGWTFTHLGYPLGLGMIAMVAVCAGLMFRTVADENRPALSAASEASSAD